MYLLFQHCFSILIHLFIRPPSISHNSSNESKWKNNQSPGARIFKSFIHSLRPDTFREFHLHRVCEHNIHRCVLERCGVVTWQCLQTVCVCVCACGKLCSPTSTFLILPDGSSLWHVTHTRQSWSFLFVDVLFWSGSRKAEQNKKSELRIFRCCFCLQVGQDDSQ